MTGEFEAERSRRLLPKVSCNCSLTGKLQHYNQIEVGVNPLAEYVERHRPNIEQALQAVTEFPDGCPSRLRDSIRYSLLSGGKRLRPLLTLLTAEAAGAEPEAAMPAATAVELIHTYSLIHDDLPAMDDDELRRGRPTNHRQFDEATAILAGDGLLTLAFHVLSTQIENASLAMSCCRELSSAAGVVGMVGGQQADLDAEHSQAQAAESPDPAGSSQQQRLELLQSIHARKTGRLITAAIRMGAIVAEVSAQQLARLTEYGNAIGLAFQIMDDILDCTGDAAQMGKQPGQDVQLGKLTYPALLGMSASHTLASELIQIAHGQIEPFGRQADGLRAVADYIIHRDR